MSSQDHHHGHLDATTGREVVYCHACSGEWYRNEHGLECQECGSEITEMVSPENDPRDLDHHSSASAFPELHPFRYHNDDSDPDEADVEEHLGPHGFAFGRSVRNGPDQRYHHNPTVDPVLERFIDMILGFGPPRRIAGGGGLFPGSPGDQEHFGQPRIHQTTFTSRPFGGGTTSITIVSGPSPGASPGASPGDARGDPFLAIFSNVLRDIGPTEEGNQAEDSGEPPPGFARSLHDILSLISPANVMAGDAVYSHEALDRIITGLMEVNPQSNAAPPASEEALRSLDRRMVDKEMLGTDGKTECAICIDEMKKGETAVFLSCEHRFHEDCVVLWLKEHNTCPVCRTPIEKNEHDRSNNNYPQGNDGAEPGQSSDGSPSSPRPRASGPGRRSP